MATINKFKCPECGKRHKTPQLMAMHRKKDHGVAGTSRSSETIRRLANPQPVANPGLNQCRHCGFQAKSSAGHSLHVNTHHAAKVEAKPQPTQIEKRANSIDRLKGSYPCKLCAFVGSWTGGLALHMNKKHPEGSVIEHTTKAEITRVVRTEEEGHATSNGHAVNPIPDAALAVALGRYQGLCQSFATEYDLPPRMFATRLAELIYNTQVRTTSRSGLRLPSL